MRLQGGGLAPDVGHSEAIRSILKAAVRSGNAWTAKIGTFLPVGAATGKVPLCWHLP